MELLRIRELAVGYPDNPNPVIEGINLVVQDGDYIGVIGPNGGGKTTLIKTLTGLLKPLGGRIEQIKRLKIGYLPQIKSIERDFPVSVKEVILSGLMADKGVTGRYKQEDKKRVMTLLKEAGIVHLKNRPIGTLSGGEVQRVLLCRALICEPQILILDEPTTFVDNRFERELYEWLGQLNQRMAIIMVSHDLGTISRYVKSIACINRCFHYHPSNVISQEQLAAYDCPIQLITHGQVPHTVLKQHGECTCCDQHTKYENHV